VSTGEVYGSTPANDVFFSEEAPLLSDNPFSASKAGADMLVKSYTITYGFPAIITRCCPTYGPCQHIGNFIPKCIINALSDKPITVCENKVREWIYVLDHCIALTKILFYGRTGESTTSPPATKYRTLTWQKRFSDLSASPTAQLKRQMTVLFQPKDVFLTATN